MFDGTLICYQYQDGYRFSLDAVLLANFIEPGPGERVLDLGAGCGVIALILAFRWPDIRTCAYELQDSLVGLIDRNIRENRFEEQVELLQGDYSVRAQLPAAGSYDWLVCNPPFRKPGSGRVSPEPEQAVARHESRGGLSQAVEAASHILKNRGRAAFVYPASRGAALISSLKNNGLEPKRLRVVYSYHGGPAKLLLVEAIKNGGEELVIEAPFYVYQEAGGAYSPEMASCYTP